MTSPSPTPTPTAPPALPAIDPTATINDLVAAYPALMPVLASRGLDLCCGGALTLREAAERHDLDLDALLAALIDALIRT